MEKRLSDILEPPLAAQAPPSFKESQAAAASASTFQTAFACVTLNMLDRIRLIDFPVSDVLAIQELVKTNWAPGVKAVENYGDARQIRMHGSPWSASYNGNDDARVLILRILERLYDLGWVMQASIDLVRKDVDKDTLVMRRQTPPPPPCDWLCVSFDTIDRLKIVGGPPRDLSDAIIELFRGRLRSEEVTPERLKIKFSSAVWVPQGEDTVTTRRLLLQLIQKLEEFGFTIYASLDMSNGREGRETDVMIVQRQRNWVPGAPIFHR